MQRNRLVRARGLERKPQSPTSGPVPYRHRIRYTTRPALPEYPPWPINRLRCKSEQKLTSSATDYITQIKLDWDGPGMEQLLTNERRAGP